MGDSEESGKEKYTEFLLKDTYAELLNWQMPDVIKTVGPFRADAFEDFASSLSASIADATEQLGRMSEHEVVGLALKGKNLDRDISQFWQEYTNGLLSRLRDYQPLWIAGGFGHPDHVADFNYWVRMKRWTLPEATAVSLGFEPASDPFEPSFDDTGYEEISDFYERRRALVGNNFNWRTPQWKGAQEVKEVCQWFCDVDLDIPDALKLEAGEFFKIKFKHVRKLKLPTGKTDPRERQAMLRLIIGMAIKGYGYDPTAKRSSIPSDIGSDLDLQGISMDLDTIRKYLREGAELFIDEGD